MFIPYRVDVPYDRRPFANWLMLGLIVAVFCQQIAVSIKYGIAIAIEQQKEQNQNDSSNAEQEQQSSDEVKDEIKNEVKWEHPLDAWILHGWNPQGLIGHMWLHGGIFHLLGNMLFLWLFGNAVCAKVGNKWFALMYLFFGFVAAVTHILFSGEPMLGASGAINGVVGMYLVFSPENEIDCLWIFFFPYMRRISVSGYWMILLWFVFDIWGAVTGGDNVAYFAHLGGFAAGFILAIFMLERKWVTMEDYEKSLLQLVGLHKTKSFDEQYSGYGTGWQPWQEEAAQQPPPAVSDTIPFDAAAQPPPATIPEAISISESPDVGEAHSVSSPPPVVSQPEGQVQPKFIKVLCSCGKKVKFPSKYSGRVGQCPACKKAIKIPYAYTSAAAVRPYSLDDDMIRFSCKCGMKIKVPRKYSGKVGKCPKCREKLIIP